MGGYVGQTTHSLETRPDQHRSAHLLLQPDRSALAEHTITQSHVIDWEAVKVVHQETGWRQRNGFYSLQNMGVARRCGYFLELSIIYVYRPVPGSHQCCRDLSLNIL